MRKNRHALFLPNLRISSGVVVLAEQLTNKRPEGVDNLLARLWSEVVFRELVEKSSRTITHTPATITVSLPTSLLFFPFFLEGAGVLKMKRERKKNSRRTSRCSLGRRRRPSDRENAA